jgi:membrane protease YdiL (CAAX protease family)
MTASRGGEVLAGLASTIVLRDVAGLIFGLVYERTRNLVAPSIV